MSVAPDVANVLRTAAQNAGSIEQGNQQAAQNGAPQTSGFDVMTHTGSGLSNRDLGDRVLNETPAGAMLGMFNSMTSPVVGSPPSAIPQAMSQGWDGVSNAAAQVGQAQGALATVGAVFGTLTAFEQMLSMAVSAIPFPAFPAVRIMDMDVGLPHAHSHPPNLVPPAPPVPLPSTGPVIPIPFLSGATKSLINGMPAARCGDMGLGIWCGGYFPMYEIFLGSSNVWVEGARAARLGVDITKHCIFTSPKPSDPPLGPMIGFTITSSFNTLIGGVPMPSLLNLAMGAAFKALFAGVGKAIKAVRGKLAKVKPRRTPPANRCKTASEPINVVTGANFDTFVDFTLASSGFQWKRFYNSRQAQVCGDLGYGFRHILERELRRVPGGWEYHDPEFDVVGFAVTEPGQTEVAHDGLVLRVLDQRRAEIRETGQPTMEFEFAEGPSTARLKALRGPAYTLQLVYDAHGRLKEVRQEDGAYLSVERNTAGQITSLKQHDDQRNQRQLACYEYEQGNLTLWRDALHKTATYAYNRAHQMTRKGDRLGYSFHYEYDDDGRCTRCYGDDGLYDSSLKYNPAERQTIEIYADGATILYQYDQQGTLTEVVDPLGGSTLYVTDDDGRIVDEIDPTGNVTSWQYDENGRHIGRKDPFGNLSGPLHLDPNPPDPLAYRLPATPLERECGKLIPRNLITQPTFDDPVLRDCPAEVSNAILHFEIAGNGTAALQSFDELGRVVSETDAAGTQSWQYDANGNRTQWRDRDGAVTKYEYVSWNNRTRVVNPVGATVSCEYNLRQYLTKVTDGGGTVTEFRLNQKDQLVAVERHGKIRERYYYDANRNLLAKTDDKDAPLLTFEVGSHNLHSARHLASGDVQRFQYNPQAQITSATNKSAKVSRAFDMRGRRVKELRDGVGVEHQFAGRQLAETSYLGKFRVAYAYDIATNAFAVTDPTGAVHKLIRSPHGLISRQLANGTSEVAQFDRAGRCVRKVVLSRAGSKNPWTRTYAYSGENELSQVKDSLHGTTAYEYDAAHRLIAETLPDGTRHAFQYDAANNLIANTHIRDVSLRSGNRLASANGETFEYNDRDHLATRTSSAGETHYSYDSLDSLVACRRNGESWQAEYDALRRRVRKTWRQQTTEYYWDGFRLAAELKHDGCVRLYVYPDDESLVPFMFVEYDDLEAAPETGRRYYLFTNQIGVPVRVEDDLGEVVWNATTDPYGMAHVAHGSRIDMPLRFPGHYFDAETGLHYNRFRYYSPELGRYLQSDPLGLAGGLNLYGYATNPLVDVDVDGLAHGSQIDEAVPPGRVEAGPNAEASNVADFERLKDSLRASMEKPHVEDPRLAGLMDELYRDGAQIGSGSTADAVRHELATGGTVGGRTHSQKAEDYSRALERWLDNNPTARAGDRAAAENVLRDMQNALNGN